MDPKCLSLQSVREKLLNEEGKNGKIESPYSSFKLDFIRLDASDQF